MNNNTPLTRKEVISLKIAILKAPNFPIALDVTFRALGTNAVQVSAISFISSRQIRRYIYGEQRIVKKTIIQIILSLQLPYDVSVLLLEKAGIVLVNSPVDEAYRKYLSIPERYDIINANIDIKERNKKLQTYEQIPLFKE